MDAAYRYDGSIEGLLTLLAHLLERRIQPQQITIALPDQQDLFSDMQTIDTDPDKAQAFWQQLVRRVTPTSLRLIRLCLLADHPRRELMICNYLLLAFDKGKQVDGLLSHPWVAPIRRLAQQVGREAHRYLGFVRFKETQGGLYYAAIAPDHRILPLLADHFCDRFSDQQWVIHDQRHHEGLLYDQTRRECLLLPMEAWAAPEPTLAEEQFQALWRRYFETMGIAERKNLRLQQSKVPLKARPWLTEFGAI